MAAVYSDCETYSDVGVVSSTVFTVEVGEKRLDDKTFATAFIRPDRFCFEFAEPEDGQQKTRCVISREGEDVQFWFFALPGIERPESLEMALAGATGVSGTAAYFVPALLMPTEIGGRGLTLMREIRRVDDARHKKNRCYRVEGRLGAGTAMVWVDIESFLIRRLDYQLDLGHTRDESSITYEPRVNCAVSPGMLEFNPPEED